MKKKIAISLGIVAFLFLLVGSLAYNFVTFPKTAPVQQANLTTAKGFWQNIHTENDEHQAVTAPTHVTSKKSEDKQ